MNFVELETFLVLADTKNLTKTAEHLYVSQSTITHRLRNLEDELQYKLFIRYRGKRMIELTERGEEFMMIARKWIALYREMELLKHHYTKTLSIAALDSVITTILPSVLNEISREKCGINVKIQTQHSGEIYQLVKKREVDIGFVTMNIQDPEIVVEEVFRQKYLLISPCKNPTKRKKIHPMDLDPSFEIFTSWGNAYDNWHEHWWSLTTPPHISVDSVAALQSFMDDERYWCVVHISALKMIQRNCSVQVYDLIEAPSDWVCYKIKHKYPNKKNIAGILAFEKIFEKFNKNNTLFRDDF